MRAHLLRNATLLCAATLCLSGCATAEPRPPGVPRSVIFGVTPVYPRSFDIVALSRRRLSPDVLKDAWRKKALMVASGRRFRSTELVVHDTESFPSSGYGSLPIKARRVTGTMTLIE